MAELRKRADGEGSIELSKRGFVWRPPRVKDPTTGKRKRPPLVVLGTFSMAEADAILDRMLAEGRSAPRPKSEWTFREAARHVAALRKAAGFKAWKDEIGRIVPSDSPHPRARRAVTAPVVDGLIGQKPVALVTEVDVNQVLDAVKAAKLSKQQVKHVRQSIVNVLAQMKREGAVSVNVAEASEVPAFAKKMELERAVATDDQLAIYLGYEHPQPGNRLAILRRQTMSIIARVLGGLRTSDLYAATWDQFVIEVDPATGLVEFYESRILRIKTQTRSRFRVPAFLQPILRDWWERHGRPTTGPIFPVMRGKRAGEHLGKQSQAHALRRDLRRAFGIEAWVVDGTRSGRGRGRPTGKFVQVRQPTARERELLEGIPGQVEPVDFHSWRRAFDQAGEDAGLTGPQLLAIDGRTSLTSMPTYLKRRAKLREIPEAMLPQIAVSERPRTGGRNRKSEDLSGPGAATPGPRFDTLTSNPPGSGPHSRATPSEEKPEMLMISSAADGTRTRGLRRDRPGYHTPASAYQPFSASPAGLDSPRHPLISGFGPRFRATPEAPGATLTLHVSRQLAAAALEILMGSKGGHHGN